MHFIFPQTIAIAVATAAPVAVLTWGLNEISNRKRVKEAKESAEAVARTAQETAVAAALAAKETRLDARSQALYEQCEARLSGLEREVRELKAELQIERENRKMAELTAQAAHVRADDAEARLAVIRFAMAELQRERDNLRADRGAHQEKIDALTACVAELESEVARLEARLAA